MVDLSLILRRWKADSEIPEACYAGWLESAWPRIVGDGLGRVSRPVSLVNGELTIEVDDPSWTNHVLELAADLKQKIATYFQGRLVRKIVIQPGTWPAAGSGSKAEPVVWKPDRRHEEWADDVVAAIHDPRLRQVLRSTLMTAGDSVMNGQMNNF